MGRGYPRFQLQPGCQSNGAATASASGVPSSRCCSAQRLAEWATSSTLAQSNSALVALGLLLLLMVARQVLRREALAIAAALLVLCLPESLAIPLPLWLVLPLDMLIVLVPTIVLVRCGLLSSIVTFYVANRLIVYPLTSDLAGPSAVPTLFLGALVLGVTLLAAHVALAGRPLFRDGLSAR